MHPKEQINADLKEAMKSRDSQRVTLIRGIMAAFKDAEHRKREELVKQALKKHNVIRPAATDARACLAGDEASSSAYSQAVSAALAAEKIGDVTPLDEAEALAVIQKLIKMRQDTIADAHKAGRQDVAEAEQHEMELLQAYLPKQLSRQEIEAEARAMIAQVGATGARDMGKVMGPLMSKLQGRADGKLISEVVKSLLPG